MRSSKADDDRVSGEDESSSVAGGGVRKGARWTFECPGTLPARFLECCKVVDRGEMRSRDAGGVRQTGRSWRVQVASGRKPVAQ